MRYIVISILHMSLVVYLLCVFVVCLFFFFFQAEDGIRDLVRSRGLGDVYKRQTGSLGTTTTSSILFGDVSYDGNVFMRFGNAMVWDLSLIHI